jgi:hypothetical protein
MSGLSPLCDQERTWDAALRPSPNIGAPPARQVQLGMKKLERMVKKWITAKSNWI